MWALRAASGSFEKLAQLQEPAELETRQKSVDILKVFILDEDFIQMIFGEAKLKIALKLKKLFPIGLILSKTPFVYRKIKKTKLAM